MQPTAVASVRALLVHLYFTQQLDAENAEEFSALARSVDVEIVDLITVPCREPQPKYVMGSGKAAEIQEAVKALDINLVLIDHEVTPSQERNLSSLWGCQVLGRTGLILAIFAKRARTYEGKLQVELAQLKHLATRLVRGWTHLERQKGGIGLRGPGETQLETDRRLLRERIKYLTARLKSVRKAREQSRRARTRADAVTVSLVGYTNAGKSTLFNALTGAMVLSADQLFATLDPTVRRMHIPQLGTVVLIDTVGFIRELPHDLVEAFRATLEETQLADLLLHVVDASDELLAEKQVAVQTVLEQINADKVPQLLVYNKIDKSNIAARIDRDALGLPYRVWVSSVTQEGMDLLQQAVSELLSQEHLTLKLLLPANAGRIRAQLYAQHVVLTETITEQGEWLLEVRLSRSVLERVFADNGEEWEKYQYSKRTLE
jgi:GTP-binding protein HflX